MTNITNAPDIAALLRLDPARPDEAASRSWRDGLIDTRIPIRDGFPRTILRMIQAIQCRQITSHRSTRH